MVGDLMTQLLEVLELILNGAGEALRSRRVPMMVRVLLAVLLLLLCGGIGVRLLLAALSSGTTTPLSLGTVLLVGLAAFCVYQIRRWRKRR